MTNIIKSTRVLAVAAFVLAAVALAFVAAPKAQAADLDFGGSSYDYFVPDSGYSYDYFVPDYGGSSYDYFVPDYGGSSYDYFVPDSGYSYDYFVPDYSYPSYSTPSFMGGSTLIPSSGGNYQTQFQNQNQHQQQTSTNVNNNVNNNNVVVNVPTQTTPTVTVQTPVCPVGTTGIYPNCVYPQPPQYDVCPNIPGIQTVVPAGYYVQNGYCYQTYVQPPVYPTYPVSQPYVTLSQVPYTGYELGPVGTVLYWSFLVLWCLIAAYLIAVKKVHNKLAAWISGSASQTTHRVAHAAPSHSRATLSHDEFAGIDPFIASQIRRTK